MCGLYYSCNNYDEFDGFMKKEKEGDVRKSYPNVHQKTLNERQDVRILGR